jgi:hypothetical protein
MDPYLLFLARRKSATPYIYAYDLNVDAALNGGFSLVPTFPQAERIRAMRNAHEADLLARLRKAPPAAFVFIDKSPLMSSEDAQEDFAAHCPETSEWVGKNYRNGATFGEVHVLLRSDLLEGVAEPSQ